MTDTGVIALPLPDEAARARVTSELETNLLVEAGAGSGKTTALVSRMVNLITTGTATVDQIAAVTFTRKAAGELRERFQMGLEREIRTEREAAPEATLTLDRLLDALDQIDRAFVGTIHSFCGRLLRERPLDIGLDPGFRELPVEERTGLRRDFWEAHLERLARDSAPVLEELSSAGLRPSTLFGLFDHLVENPDVDFPAEVTLPPSGAEVAAVRAELEAIVDRGWELMDDAPPLGKDWDSLQKKIRRLHFERDISGWSEDSDLFEAIATLCKPGPRGHSATFNRWREKEMTRDLVERTNVFGVGDTAAQRLVAQWYAHRYALAIRLCQHAVSDFAAHRLGIGRLDFQDLLVLTARLLRSNPNVRQQLGERYQRLLIDEFQDTDPLQAEIMLLLSSDPEIEGDEAPPGGGSTTDEWRHAIPRPGALFVVGDPKQSIYRFRRADIQLYGFVKERFSAFGAVVALSTNFRSRPPIGDLVNDLFCDAGFFPPSATAEQAAFERLDTRPASEEVVAEGVFVYDIAPEHANKDSAGADDAERLGSWILERVDAGERVPGDFLILTRGRGQLASYARSLEARRLPVQVTGAGVGVEEEIRELEILLQCMIDPSNAVGVVAALVGLFFGIDYERLVAHRLDGGGFDAMWPGDHGHPDVLAALAKLNAWWRASVGEAADIFVGRIVAELGLLPYAAAGDLGTLRAGALLYALDSVRAAALAGDSSLPGALAALRSALDLKEAEAPLEPGRPDAVRLMNLHQAKGLEANVVVLADPTENRVRRPDSHMSRSADGVAQGFLRITASGTGWKPAADLARPVGWPEMEAAEQRFTEAEEVRLLYVSVTRAREELVVARWPGGRGTSAWAALDPWLDHKAQRLTLDIRAAPPREELDLDPGDAAREAAAAREKLEAMGRPRYTHMSVTALTKQVGVAVETTPDIPSRNGGQVYRGFAWGSAVHGALAVAAGSEGADRLRAACRNLLVENGRPLDDHGEPVELRELLDLVQSVMASQLWQRAQRAERSLVEVSFALPGVSALDSLDDSGDALSSGEPSNPSESSNPDEPSKPDDLAKLSAEGKRQLDLFNASPETSAPVAERTPPERADGDPAGITVMEGVVDLAFREPDGWVIADYKTDIGTDPDFAAREAAYRKQVELYADAWSRLTGERVKERVLFFTAQDRIESW